ncbi:uncharacterized protein F54H12.2-like [Belonocnema kinseyi]|uniref:uncharacterized protein F54H12.2-like n=1 Tax=Belonocnema kinseyi TaxID=2817044 RepID=UPI00143D89FD|nr:uncharacterized protein F54H12.2-like [Belonocnema kinseyi]
MDPTSRVSIHSEETSLLVHRAKISPGISLAHAKALAPGTAKYPITRVNVKALTIHAGIQSEILDNVVLGQLPKRIIIGFVDNAAYNGNALKTPLKFQTYNKNHFSLYVGGMKIPSKPIQPDFTKNNLYVDAYHSLFTGCGIHFLNEGNNIDRNDYAHGFCLFAFDLTPDLSAHCYLHWNLVKHGYSRIEVRLEEALEHTINCLVYAEYDKVLEIDGSKQVIADYSN